MLTFEYIEPKQSVCECCQNRNTVLTRFIYKNDDAYGIYYASFSEGHAEKRVDAIISLGDWGGDYPKAPNRVSFPFQVWPTNDEFHISLINAEDSPWKHVDLLGTILGRQQALSHKWVKEIFYITDQILLEDKEILRYFG